MLAKLTTDASPKRAARPAQSLPHPPPHPLSPPETLDLDDPIVQTAVRGNSNGFLATPPPVCIDEYQKVLELLEAIKARFNRSSPQGSIVLTGSTRYQALPLAARSLTSDACDPFGYWHRDAHLNPTSNFSSASQVTLR